MSCNPPLKKKILVLSGQFQKMKDMGIYIVLQGINEINGGEWLYPQNRYGEGLVDFGERSDDVILDDPDNIKKGAESHHHENLKL